MLNIDMSGLHKSLHGSLIILSAMDKNPSLDNTRMSDYKITKLSAYYAACVIYLHNDYAHVTVIKDRYGMTGEYPIDYVTERFKITPEEFLACILSHVL